MKYLLDTNVISEVMRREPAPQVKKWFSSLTTCYISSITWEELIFGLRHRGLTKQEAWLRQIMNEKGMIYPVTPLAALWSGEKRSQLQLRGKTITMADSLIAACSHENGLILATRNTKDFLDLGISLFNPFDLTPKD